MQEVDARAAHGSIWWLASKQTPECRIKLYLSCVVQLQWRLTASILRQCASRQTGGYAEKGVSLLIWKEKSLGFIQNGPFKY